MTSKLPPRQAGFYVFHGRRNIRGAIYESLHEPVEIRVYANGRAPELAVCLTGRAEKFPLKNFVGEWTVLELEEE